MRTFVKLVAALVIIVVVITATLNRVVVKIEWKSMPHHSTNSTKSSSSPTPSPPPSPAPSPAPSSPSSSRTPSSPPLVFNWTITAPTNVSVFRAPKSCTATEKSRPLWIGTPSATWYTVGSHQRAHNTSPPPPPPPPPSSSSLSPFVYPLYHLKFSSKVDAVLMKNHRPAYKSIGRNRSLALKIFIESTPSNRHATFRDVIATSDGYIIHPRTCASVQQHGCNANTVASVGSGASLKSYERVVFISARFGHGFFHFAMECLVGLANLPQAMSAGGEVVVMVAMRRPFMLEWLRLLGVPSGNVVAGRVHARTLIVPEMGLCGRPSQFQLIWLRNAVSQSIKMTIPTVHDLYRRGNATLVLVHRTIARTVRNWAEVVQVATMRARMLNLTVVIHTDAKNTSLPPIEAQVRRFARAALLIAPAGAGEIFTVFMPRGASVIEFFAPSFSHDVNLCHAHVSSLSGMRWHGICGGFGGPVNITELNATITTATRHWPSPVPLR